MCLKGVPFCTSRLCWVSKMRVPKRTPPNINTHVYESGREALLPSVTQLMLEIIFAAAYIILTVMEMCMIDMMG